MTATWQNRRLPILYTLSNNNLVAIQRKVPLREIWNPESRLWSPSGDETEEDHFEKASPCPDGRLTHCGCGYRLGNRSGPCELLNSDVAPFRLVLSLSGTKCQGTWQESHRPMPPVISSPTLVQVVDPEIASDLIPGIHWTLCPSVFPELRSQSLVQLQILKQFQ